MENLRRFDKERWQESCGHWGVFAQISPMPDREIAVSRIDVPVRPLIEASDPGWQRCGTLPAGELGLGQGTKAWRRDIY
jgi:hypothetical protein